MDFVGWSILAFLAGCLVLSLVVCLMIVVHKAINALEEEWGIYLFKSRTFCGRILDVLAVIFFVLMLGLVLTYAGFMLLDWFGIYTKLEF